MTPAYPENTVLVQGPTHPQKSVGGLLSYSGDPVLRSHGARRSGGYGSGRRDLASNKIFLGGLSGL